MSSRNTVQELLNEHYAHSDRVATKDEIAYHIVNFNSNAERDKLTNKSMVDNQPPSTEIYNQTSVVDLEEFKSNYRQEGFLVSILKQDIKIVSQTDPETAEMLSFLMGTVKRIYKHHKNGNNIQAMSKAVAAKRELADLKAKEL